MNKIKNILKLNPLFSDFEDLINIRLQDNFGHINQSFYSYSELKLLAACETHAEKHSTGNVHENVLGVVHPFYMHLRPKHKMELTQDTQNDAQEYLNNIISLLTDERRNYSIILFDTAHNYANSTSNLAELGLIDDIIFTQPITGHFVNDTKAVTILEKYMHSDFYIAGAYTGTTPRETGNFACVGDVEEKIKYHINKEVKLIQNCCIYSPIFEKRELLTIPPLYNTSSLTDFFIKTENIVLPK